MKVIFLDFDGVLNSRRFMLECAEGGRSGVTGLDPKAVAHLNRICRQTGAAIVVSSSWRIGRTLEQLREVLREAGCTAAVEDATPRSYEIADAKLARAFAERGIGLTDEEAGHVLVAAKGRGREIDAWLSKREGKVESFVVLDDDSDVAPHGDRHVKTTFADGLMGEHVPLALEILSRPWGRP